MPFDLLIVDKEFLPQVAPDRFFALSLGKTADGIKVVCFDAVKIVLRLSVDRSKNSVGVGFADDVGDAVIIADYFYICGLLLPTGEIGRFVCVGKRN